MNKKIILILLCQLVGGTLFSNYFYDFAKIAPSNRIARCKVIQCLFARDPNIGDYLPAFGIHQMLGFTPDTWSTHDWKNMDFNFINENYKCMIIGGAGLLHPGQEPFWARIAHECKIPIIIWGVGCCMPHYLLKKTVDLIYVEKVLKKCIAINVRDDLTKETYNMIDASVTLCPCIVYLKKFLPEVNKHSNAITYCGYNIAQTKNFDNQIIELLQEQSQTVQVTTNFISHNSIEELEDHIRKYYCNTKLIITSRLHGAIIAHALGIPYIAMPFYDKKLMAFFDNFSHNHGLLATNIVMLKDILIKEEYKNLQGLIDYSDVEAFGLKAKKYISLLLEEKKIR